jgi:hypothetical protein
MPRAGFEPAVPATKRQQTYAVDGTATGIGLEAIYTAYKLNTVWAYNLWIS